LFNELELKALAFVDSHIKLYGKLPDVETFEKELDAKLPAPTENLAFHAQKLKDRYISEGIRDIRENDEIKKLLSDKSKLDEYDPGKALILILEKAISLSMNVHGSSLYDMRNALDIVKPLYMAKKAEQMGALPVGVSLGFPSLDEMMQGAQGGDLLSIVGRPGMGKTYLMHAMAIYAWLTQGAVPLFVSMEMAARLVATRIAAMHAHKPFDLIKGGMLPNMPMDDEAQLWVMLEKLKHAEVPFHLVDGNLTAMVSDIFMLARQLKPSIIFIDGAYLLGHPSERDRYRKVAENCDLLKKTLATELDVPVVCSWQFNKDAAKKKKNGETPGLEDIGYSDAIGQHSSVVMGLFEAENSVETLYRRTVTILKGRSGETGRFDINWKFAEMDFSEIAKDSLTALNHG
jgi:replicative DNA helicase